VDRTVVAVAKEFAPGSTTGRHSHVRAQFIFAIRGLMVATTDAGNWLVPPGHALWLPAGISHNVAMHGAVSMRTAYLRAEDERDLPRDCRVVIVQPLLETALVALSAEPPAYGTAGRGGHLASLILDEITHAPTTPFALPVPADRRLRRLAQRLIEHPGSPLDIDHWADEVGVSRRTLTRVFRTQTGLSFGAWRRRLRLLRGAARCADGEPLAHVAAGLGYNSLAAFQSMARRELGTDFAQLRSPEPNLSPTSEPPPPAPAAR
jgi:AraC-like DNA-binding protein